MKILPIILIFFSSLACAQDDVLVSYSFDGASSLSEMLSPSKVHRQVSATSITGKNLTVVPQHAFARSLENRLAARANIKTRRPSVNDALENNTYFSFTITPEAGQEIVFSELTFTAQGGGESPCRAFYVFCQADGFSAQDLLLSAIQAGNEDDTLNSENPTSYSIKLPDMRVNAPSEFRIYINSDSDRKTVIFNDITLHGKVSAGR
ncbi:hypothetical protein [Ruficoccus sp. ZRK36]|uniref:hypothetical protein n=1 Tax=Ruficoccus sp. ZRK36 TaxID=2866311 RepID=UPI001C73B3B2|nr:hypothetical protein [Ruficoccus sp. ZRK36]QYY37453.1 hypothetical protein K0V07_08185 [Ruficoccus sp. ZRK36]